MDNQKKNTGGNTFRPSPDALLNPRYDANFKALFTYNSDEARLALKSFLEAVLEAKVTNIELRPNEPAIDSATDKQATFDITCTLNGNEAVEIEMQGWNVDASYDRRAEYLVARLLNHYTPSGTDWDKVPKVFQISVLNFIHDNSSKQNISLYRMRTDDNRSLSDRMTVIFMELPKIKKLPDDIKNLTTAEKWGKFILYADNADKADFVKTLCESEEGIMAANVTLAKISEDEANWLRERAHDKWMRDYNTGMSNAERRGIQKGIQQGAIETARKMISDGLSSEIIVKYTALPISEIEKLQAETT